MTDLARRKFLVSAATSLGLAAAARGRRLSAFQAAASQKPNRIDIHHHFAPPAWVAEVKGRPLLNVANQLVWSADGRGVHSVWVDGRRVVDNYRCITIDEDRFYDEVQRAGETIVARSGLPDKAKWPKI